MDASSRRQLTRSLSLFFSLSTMLSRQCLFRTAVSPAKDRPTNHYRGNRYADDPVPSSPTATLRPTHPANRYRDAMTVPPVRNKTDGKK